MQYYIESGIFFWILNWMNEQPNPSSKIEKSWIFGFCWIIVGLLLDWIFLVQSNPIIQQKSKSPVFLDF
jgi:hypothetical protein